jgi:hypothetical protein
VSASLRYSILKMGRFYSPENVQSNIVQEVHINGSDLLHPNPHYTIHLGLLGMGGQALDLVIEI